MKNLTRLIAIACAVAVFAGCGGQQEQGRVTISPPAAHPDFDELFVKDREIRFDMPEDLVLGQIGRTVVNSRGEFIVQDPFQKNLFRADAEGNYLHQIGSRGGGEGEYYSISQLALDKDGDLYIQSMGEGIKYMVYSGDSYELKREVAITVGEFVDQVIITEEGNMFGSKVDSENALIRYNDNFEQVEFMYEVADQRTAVALHRYHNTLLTPRSGGGFYFMYPTTYEIHRYSEEGELVETLYSDTHSKHRDGINPFPASLPPHAWSPQHEEWIAEHIIRYQLFECDPDLLVVTQYRRKMGGDYEFYLNVLDKEGNAIADGVRLPEGYSVATFSGSEAYFRVQGDFNAETGESTDPYLAVYKIADLAEAAKGPLAFDSFSTGE